MTTDPTLDWATTRQDISRAYGEPPGPTLEAPIITAFENNPNALIKIADEVAELYRNGDIHSPWPILRKRIERINEPLRNTTVKRPDARGKAIARAEQWIRTAGVHYDRETEVEDELFGDFGILKDWAKDEPLRARLIAAWNKARPIGVRLEREAYVRAEKWKRTTAKLRAQDKPPPKPRLELVRASLFHDTQPEEDPDA